MGQNRALFQPLEVVEASAAGTGGAAIQTEFDKDLYLLTSGPGVADLWTVTLDPNAVAGDVVEIKDAAHNGDTRTITVQVKAGSGQHIQVAGANLTTYSLVSPGACLRLVYQSVAADGVTPLALWQGELLGGI